MTEPRVRLDLGVTLPGPGSDGRYSPIKVNASVEVDAGANFEADLATSIEALTKTADPLAQVVAQQYTDMTKADMSDTFKTFRANLAAWQERVVANVRKLNEATGLTKPKDPAEAELEAALAKDKIDNPPVKVTSKVRRRAAK